MKKLKNKDKIILTILILITVIILLLRFLPYQLGVNLTESLPQKIFLVKKGELPKRGEYAVFNHSNKWYKDFSFVKQVIGMEGDEIKESNKKVWIISKLDQKITDAGIAKEFSLRGEKLTIIQVGIIPAGYYFVHAPNLDSLDSRYNDIGLISEKEIVGRAIPINGYFIIFLLIIILLFFIRFKFFKPKALKIIILPLMALFFFNNSVKAKDLGIHGEVYPIAEIDLTKYIKSKLTKLQKSGQLAQIEKEWQEKTKSRTERPKPVEDLVKASKTREFIFDPSIIVKQDIFDHQGNLIVAKGKKVNPLDFRDLSEYLLFIDGDDKKQLAWAKAKSKSHTAMIILTNGGIMDLMRQEKIRFYFDQEGFLIKTFGIKALPAIVYQDEKVLKIREEVL